MSEANDRPFAFERVCEVLGLDAGSVRDAVLGNKCSEASAAAARAEA